MIDDYLQRVQLIDCEGRVTHTLTALLDGHVRVRTGTLEATIEPATRTVRPTGARLGAGEYNHQQIIDIARTLAADIGR